MKPMDQLDHEVDEFLAGQVRTARFQAYFAARDYVSLFKMVDEARMAQGGGLDA